MHIDPNALTSPLNAARYYCDALGWVVHPLHGPNEGTPKERGKKPRLRGWKQLDIWGCDEAFLQKHFGGAAPANVGVVVQPPHIVIDLDSKKDGGESVRAWLSSQPQLSKLPRERTAGGAHLHLLCNDVPTEAIEAAGRNQKLTATLTETVTAEIFLGGNVVVAPSIHPTGIQYQWEVAGEIPTIPWATLQQIFLSNQPVAPRPKQQGTRQRKEPPFWAHYKGKLNTLDIVALAKYLGIYGQPLGSEERKHTVKCPWREQHSDANIPWSAGDSSTVVWEAHGTSFPNFFCSHTTHGEKTLADFLLWADTREPGVVDRFCKERRVFKQENLKEASIVKNPKFRPQVILPGNGRLDTEFARDVGLVMGRRKSWYLKSSLIVEIKQQRERVKVRISDIENNPEGFGDEPRYVEFTGFALLRPNRAITSLEEHVEPGILVKAEGDADDYEFVPKSMNNKQAAILIEADALMKQLPEVERILDVPLPVIDPSTGEITFPKRGHDPRFNTYLVGEEIDFTEMSLDDAKGILHEILQDFCFKSETDLVHAVAALITPFCRGLFDRWTSRTPVFFYKANRPRAGKDYLAGCVGLIYEGRTNEDAPLTSDTDETRKKITSALISGRRRIHFSNCAGQIRNDVFEQIVTNERWSDRTLGSNQEVTIPNEIEFSLSGNTGVMYSPDFAARTRTISLHFEEEHENQRTFSKPDLHGWVLENRQLILSAVFSMVKHWDACGRPKAPTPFTSFPSWAHVVGGVMHACGLGDPCQPDADIINLGGDNETRDMKRLYQYAYGKYPERWLSKKEVREMVQDAADDEEAEEMFAYLDFTAQSGKVRFGNIVEKYVGRVLGDIRMVKDGTTARVARQQLMFTKDENNTPKQDVFKSLFGNRPETDCQDCQIGEIRPQDAGSVGSVGSHSIPTGEFEKLQSSKNIKSNNKKTQVYKNNIFKYGVERTTKSAKTTQWHLVSDSGEFDEIAEAIAIANCPVSLDIETYGRDALNAWRSDIRLLTLALPGQTPWLIDLQATGYDLGGLGEVLSNCELIIHNARFDLGFLRHHCGLRAKRVFCTMTAARLLSAGTRQSNRLGDVLRRYGIADLAKEHGTSDWGGMLFDDQLAYAAEDVAHLFDLHQKLRDELEAAGLSQVMELETRLLPLVVDMEASGFVMDKAKLEALRDAHRKEATELGNQVQELLGGTFNPGSPDQLKAAFNAAGVNIDSTAEGVLVKVKHPAAAKVLEMRGTESVAKQAQSLLDSIEDDGRIHGEFDPTGTEAGRFSAKRPNLQNVGRGSLRECFIAPAGATLVCADYSQIELRVAAALAGETKMLEAYRSGADLHRRTAALVLGKSEDEVTKDERQMAKAISFGSLYGQSASGLVDYAKSSYGVTMTEGEAERIREKFFRAYRTLAKWHEDMRALANRGYEETRTRFGRRRLMPKGSDKFWQRFSGGLNTPVQGGAADGIKHALVLLSGKLPAGAAIISTVHDEIIVQCPEHEADTVKSVMETAMREAMAELYPEVPIVVEAHNGNTWGEAK